MKALLLKHIYDLSQCSQPLEVADVPIPIPGEREILVKVTACGVCHTELDEIEGRTPPPSFPMILGHQVVGHLVERGPQARKYNLGERVGIAWIYWACGKCVACLSGNENLCYQFQATGRDANGGYAEYMTVDENFAFRIPDLFDDSEAAPLLCAGAIGYRSLRLSMLEDGQALGLTGFGSSAHLVLKLVRYQFPQARVYVFSRSPVEQEFARQLGAVWAGGIEETSPEPLNCIIDTTPAWKPVVEALRNLAPGGRLVINAIRKENIDKETLLNLDYSTHLWMEKEIKSVANVTRRDASEFLELAACSQIKPEVHEYSMDEANIALLEMKNRKIRGAKVLCY